MKTQRIFIALSVINLGLTIFLLAQLHRVDARSADPGSPAPVLRGARSRSSTIRDEYERA